jgi:hypothetical protein
MLLPTPGNFRSNGHCKTFVHVCVCVKKTCVYFIYTKAISICLKLHMLHETANIYAPCLCLYRTINCICVKAKCSTIGIYCCSHVRLSLICERHRRHDPNFINNLLCIHTYCKNYNSTLTESTTT